MITEINIKHHIEKTDYFNNLTGTNRFKQILILKRAKEIFHNYDLASRQGIDYIRQFTSVSDVELITELLCFKN